MCALLKELQAIIPELDDARSVAVVAWLKALIGDLSKPVQWYIPTWCYRYIQLYANKHPQVSTQDKWELVQYWVSNPSLPLNTGVSALRFDEIYTFQLPELWPRNGSDFYLWIQLDEANLCKDTPFFAQVCLKVGDEDETFEYELSENVVDIDLHNVLDKPGLYCIKFDTTTPMDIATINSLKHEECILDRRWMFDVQLFTYDEKLEESVSLPVGRILCLDTIDYRPDQDWQYLYLPPNETLTDFLYVKSNNVSPYGQELAEYDVDPVNSYYFEELIEGQTKCLLKVDDSFEEVAISFCEPQSHARITPLEKILNDSKTKKTFTNLLDA